MRGTTAYVSNIEDIQRWFELQPRSNWTLASNFCDSIPTNGKGVIYRQDNSDLAKEDSWNLLHELIAMQSPGARLTVFVASNDAGNRVQSMRYQHGMAPAAWGQPSGFPAVAGLPLGVGSVQEAIAKEREKWELERRLEDLEAQLSGPQQGGIWGIVERKLQEADATELINTVTGLGLALLEKFMPAAKPVQLAGAPHLDDDNHDDDHDDTAEGSQQPQYQFQTARVIPVLVAIRQHFDNDEEFYQFIERLSAKFGENPAFYKTMLK